MWSLRKYFLLVKGHGFGPIQLENTWSTGEEGGTMAAMQAFLYITASHDVGGVFTPQHARAQCTVYMIDSAERWNRPSQKEASRELRRRDGVGAVSRHKKCMCGCL